ncbi:thiamine-phosphate diphosphorylase [Clostridium collagenovorans DSM 3089]|uniref:Thiamine-phosphate synthase n=1 Tax=Clostridium collagenovorans DSM 3089 TaxID=1121306 RepID=A0A1M5T9M9_9CLOT|nr:thiamine phosphate synthase [Clostridium collagenovorans]SHH47422.1 thiamine-phosphate diphosphorylase [Clostridium collagenovorans DSM 3089]
MDSKKLYLVTDHRIEFQELLKKVEESLKSGVSMVQYRSKSNSTRKMIEEANLLKVLCDKYKAVFLINDRVDVAQAVDADGVHLGQDDMEVSVARRILGPNKIIGITAHNKEEAINAEKNGANNLGIGALFSTSTKSDATAMSLETLREIRKSVSIPLYGIGGITTENLTAEILKNIDGIAVVSAILNCDNIQVTCDQFKKLL